MLTGAIEQRKISPVLKAAKDALIIYPGNLNRQKLLLYFS